MRSIITTMVLVAGISGAALAADSQAAVPPLVTQICGACHGMDGNGIEPPNTAYPKLAGLHAAYLAKQLKDFKSGARKSDLMVPWAAMLDEDGIRELSEYFASKPHRPEPIQRPELLDLGRNIHVDGNPETGVPACAGCHQPDARGTSRFPLLAGQYAEYTYIELHRFANDLRDNDRGLVMQSVALRMTEGEMRAVAEYLMSLQ